MLFNLDWIPTIGLYTNCSGMGIWASLLDLTKKDAKAIPRSTLVWHWQKPAINQSWNSNWKAWKGPKMKAKAMKKLDVGIKQNCDQRTPTESELTRSN